LKLIFQPGSTHSKESIELDATTADTGSGSDSFVECQICGDHILKDFLSRHIKMNHPQVN
jgi:hypothetical protein